MDARKSAPSALALNPPTDWHGAYDVNEVHADKERENNEKPFARKERERHEFRETRIDPVVFEAERWFREVLYDFERFLPS